MKRIIILAIALLMVLSVNFSIHAADTDILSVCGIEVTDVKGSGSISDPYLIFAPITYSETIFDINDITFSAQTDAVLYSDAQFENAINSLDLNSYLHEVYVEANSSYYRIELKVTYNSGVDSSDYYFDFNENLETSENGLKNSILPTGEVVYCNDGERLNVMSELGDGNITEATPASVLYPLRDAINLEWDKNWSIEMRALTQSKMGVFFASDDAYKNTNLFFRTGDGCMNMVGEVRTQVGSSLLNNMNDFVIENKVTNDGNVINFKYKKSEDNEWSQTFTFDKTKLAYSKMDIPITRLFSLYNATLGYKGQVDYIYIHTDLYKSAAMEYVKRYSELFSTSTENITDDLVEEVRQAVSEYNELSDAVKACLTKNEQQILKTLGRLLATGDTGISSVFGNIVSLTGNGTIETPYSADVSINYLTSTVYPTNIITNDEWAEIVLCNGEDYETSVNNIPINDYLTDMFFKVISGTHTGYYKLRLFTTDLTEITNSNMKQFVEKYEDILCLNEKTVTMENKEKILDAIEEYNNLSEETKKTFIRNEYGKLNNLYIYALLADINASANYNELQLAMTNDVGIYPTNEFVAKVIFSTRPSSGFTSREMFDEHYNMSVIASEIIEEDNISQVLEKHKDVLIIRDGNGDIYIDCYQNYLGLNQLAKDYLSNIIKYETFEREKIFPYVFQEYCILAGVKTSQSYGGLKNVILGMDSTGKIVNNNFNIIYPDVSIYDKLSSKEKTFVKMYGKLEEIDEFSDIRSVFYDSSLEAYNTEKSGAPSGTGGNSSSASSKSSRGSTRDFSVVAEEQTDKEMVFSDISGHWAEKAIYLMSERNIVTGYDDNTFKPDKFVTRAEFAKILVNVFGFKAKSQVNFEDINETDWFYPYVKVAATNNIVLGYEGKFYPNDEISRQDAVVMLYRCIENKMVFSNNTYQFKDFDEIDEYARVAINDLAFAGIISGKGANKFAPKDSATRAEALILIAGAIDYGNVK